jgi:hypothetical protein
MVVARAIRVLVGFTVGAASIGVVPVSGFFDTNDNANYAQGVVTYGFFPDSTFPLDRPSVNAGAANWGIQAQSFIQNFSHSAGNTQRTIEYLPIDGAGGLLANATIGCDSNASTCIMRFDQQEPGGTLFWTPARTQRLATRRVRPLDGPGPHRP